MYSASTATGISRPRITGRWNSGLPGFIGRPGPGEGSGRRLNFCIGPMFISIMIGLMINDPIPHQPCHRLFEVMSRTDAIPQVRQNGPCSFSHFIRMIRPWCPRTVASTAGNPPQNRHCC